MRVLGDSAATVGIYGAILAGVGGLIVSVFNLYSGRKDRDEDQDETHRVNEFEIMDKTIAVLRKNLDDAQTETDLLRADLAKARDETRLLKEEVTTALANVATLSEHIRDHVPPEVPFPTLRKVTGRG